ncbi:type VI secretion system contractile sheath large subunit [Sulfurimonas lithotrophica]|uniref:Type VI secretion system contractile sheath large subunit n=1 Tax=Sulfurimonas lithotrophica TaxID=2590022 RepID=A0A5P8NZR8_9BACT|nr:type VI secretion system contractile sheath large subunit [Sulfurimonas lithotrophica]QFR48933.1 type VI secretion system contractile sheath large subunit [Sulfurimonas lithotrophica]
MSAVEATVSNEVLNSDSLLDSIIAQTSITQEDDTYSVVKSGVGALIEELIQSDNPDEKVNKAVIDKMIAEIDAKISAQMDEILHHEKFQELESKWRGLYFLVEKTDFRENILMEMINVTKEDLIEDFEDCLDITQTGLYKHVYTSGYGQFGGEPVGTMVADFELSPSNVDMKFLTKMASISAMSHAPLITAAGPKFFGLDSFEGLPNLKDLEDVMNSPQFAAWKGFRKNEDSRYVGMTLPRFLLRAPYHPEDNPISKFVYQEDVSSSHEDYLWGSTVYTLASKLTDSFANYRWCTNIIGPMSGGEVRDLPVHTFESMGDVEMKIPTEVLVSDRREYELAQEGFIPLVMRKGSNSAAFFAANSAQEPKIFADTPEGNEAELNYKLGTQLPYLFAVTRMAHYIKVLQREHIGSWREREDLERELNKWAKQYVANQENPSAEIRSKRPFKKIQIDVEDIAKDPGWYKVKIALRPHFKYMGANFELSLVGKLDKD